MLPGTLVLKSDEHWTSHSVPGIRSQQMAVQSPSTAETTARWFTAALAFDVTVFISVDVEINVDVAGIDVGKSVSHEAPHDVAMAPKKPVTSSQMAVQPPLTTVTVTNSCRLARTGLPATLVAVTVHTRLTRPKTTDLVIRILPMVMRLMDAKKNVQVLYWSLGDDMGCSSGRRAML